MINEIKNNIVKNKEKLLEILMDMETSEVANEEIELSIKALENSSKYTDGKAEIIASYLPMNLPLFSLITYVVIPNICSDKSYYRPSTKTIEISKKIHKVLELDNYNIELCECSRFKYNKDYVKKANVIIFVGKPENALKLENSLTLDQMFIYFGVGQNPAVIESDANLKIASKKIVESIMFNYGQDCAKPNIILCKKSLYPEFKKLLLKEINDSINKKTSIKNLETFKDVIKLLIKDKDYLEYGGQIDVSNQIIEPIIITKDYSDRKENYDEYYAPVFRIMLYNNVNDLKKYFSNEKYKKENMNISLFGKSSFVEKLPASLVLNNEIVSDIDNGYCEYGGYGQNTSYLSYGGVKIHKPLLINREISNFYNNKNFIERSNNSSNNKLKNETKIKNIIFKECNDSIFKIFGNNLNFSFIFGSYAKNYFSSTSDIDMFVCLNEIDNKSIDEFRKWYFKLHYMYGKFPDFLYPGEIINNEKLENILNNNDKINFDIFNDSTVFDALFYTQIFSDKKVSLMGNTKNLLEYQNEFKKYVPIFCEKIFEVLLKNNKVKDDRDYMKCMVALASNDLFFFGRRVNFENINNDYSGIIDKIDDGFLKKCVYKRQIYPYLHNDK